jgi:hypothetical protein
VQLAQVDCRKQPTGTALAFAEPVEFSKQATAFPGGAASQGGHQSSLPRGFLLRYAAGDPR